MIQGSGVNSHVVSTPAMGTIEPMENVGAPGYIYGQGVYYPAAASMSEYYYTGYGTPGGWNGHNGFFALDGQNFNYPGLQTENFPYVYYTPYGYTHSQFNPYNPCIPGAVVGVDGSYVGAQPYYTGDPYQQPIPSAYYPLVYQPSPNGIFNGSFEPHSFNSSNSIISEPRGSSVSNNTTLAPVGTSVVPQTPAAGHVRAKNIGNGFSSSNLAITTDGSRSDAVPTIPPVGIQSVGSGSFTRSAPAYISQGRMASRSTQVAEKWPVDVFSSHYPVRSGSSANGLLGNGSMARGWGVDKLKTKSNYSGYLKNGNGYLGVFDDQNRGPRSIRSNNNLVQSVSVESNNTDSGSAPGQGNSTIRADQYNSENFLVSYSDAKFFVIKSYSEDDVHKSIKYNVWTSTSSGNKKLNNAFEVAQGIAGESPRGCPIFLFFSVNTSGQFCGVAEMVGPVDFDADMQFWQQDKWNGSFPVKWHMIKDVPNSYLRQIILENNENKPVTNSRDTQEIYFEPGLEMLKIFKNFKSKTSLLDDLSFYELRQEIMEEEKKRLFGESYNGSLSKPAFVPSAKSNGIVDSLPVLSDKPRRSDLNNIWKVVTPSGGVPCEPVLTNSSKGKEKVESDEAKDADEITSVIEEIGVLVTDPKQTEANMSMAFLTKQDTEEADVVTVGSMATLTKQGTDEGDVVTVGSMAALTKQVTDEGDVVTVGSMAALANQDTEEGDVVTVGSMPVKINGFTESSFSGDLIVSEAQNFEK